MAEGVGPGSGSGATGWDEIACGGRDAPAAADGWLKGVRAIRRIA